VNERRKRISEKAKKKRIEQFQHEEQDLQYLQEKEVKKAPQSVSMSPKTSPQNTDLDVDDEPDEVRIE